MRPHHRAQVRRKKIEKGRRIDGAQRRDRKEPIDRGTESPGVEVAAPVHGLLGGVVEVEEYAKRRCPPARCRRKGPTECHDALGGAAHARLPGEAPFGVGNCAGLMSTATTSWRGASCIAVQPADAMQKTRPPGRNAPRSIDASSYIRPKSTLLGPRPASKRPRSQAVSATERVAFIRASSPQPRRG